MVGRHRRDLAARQGVPQGLSVGLRAQRRLSHVLAAVRFGEALFSQKEIERTRLDPERRAAGSATTHLLERASAGEMDDIRRRPALLGERGPPEATIHALFHGRVLFQYRPGLARRDQGALERLTRADPDRVLLFENQTGMHAAVAATAYLSVMTCPRVDRPALAALTAFRERRRAFGQSF